MSGPNWPCGLGGEDVYKETVYDRRRTIHTT